MSELGSLGGKSNVKRHGRLHLSKIGKMGAKKRWAKRSKLPKSKESIAKMEEEKKEGEGVETGTEAGSESAADEGQKEGEGEGEKAAE